MPTSLDVTIRGWLARYLAGEISLPEFEEQFVPATWNRVGQGDDRLDRLVGEIELRIAEFTSRHRSEDDTKALLRPLLANPASNPSPRVASSPPLVIEIARRSSRVQVRSAAQRAITVTRPAEGVPSVHRSAAPRRSATAQNEHRVLTA